MKEGRWEEEILLADAENKIAKNEEEPYENDDLEVEG